ncbi:MAG: SIMPL domain-containing protein [Planctomycetota bacterium]|jgi:uncharacterized protein YggE|nr:SIMPL domain-containing protein [Planctomycetota bacterium]
MNFRTILAILIAALSLCACQSAHTRVDPAPLDIEPEPADPRSFSGYGKQFYTATSFDLNAEIVTTDLEVRTCMQKHLAAVTAVDSYCGELADTEYSRVPAALTLEYDHTQKADHYVYTTRISLRSRNIGELAQIQADLIEHGVNRLGEAQLFTENPVAVRRQARDLAVANAREQAEYLEQALGWGGFEILNIQLQGEQRHYLINVGGNPASGAFGNRAGSGRRPSGKSSVGNNAFIDAKITLTIRPLPKRSAPAAKSALPGSETPTPN